MFIWSWGSVKCPD